WGGNRACCVVDDDLYVVGNIESAGFKPSAYIARWSDPTGTGTPVFGSDSSGLILEIPRNPIRGDFPIVFHLDRASEAAIDVVDVRGSRVVNLVDGRMEPGRHEVWWRVSSAFERVPTGVYYIRLRSGTKVVSKSVVFLR
ncbi:MAG TPA: hypothetical protein VFR10_08345, partial [bacterium]|nr:hypothetical protein [bacterium]